MYLPSIVIDNICRRNPLALVLEPSRELAEQTHTAFVQFSKYLNGPAVDCGLLAGGGNNSAQLHQLSEGVDIITGTLGRLEGEARTDLDLVADLFDLIIGLLIISYSFD
jgi:ATP-dependent RNA helicase DDX1